MNVTGATGIDPPDSLLSPQLDWPLLGFIAALYIAAIVYGLRNRS